MARLKGTTDKEVMKREIEDLKLEVSILKAALKQFIMEQKMWRLANESAIRILNSIVLGTPGELGSTVFNVRPVHPGGNGGETEPIQPEHR